MTPLSSPLWVIGRKLGENELEKVTDASSGDSSSSSSAWASFRSARTLLQPSCDCGTSTRRRLRLAAAVALTGTGLLGASLSTKPASKQFYALTFSVAGTWLIGGLAVEPLRWDSLPGKNRSFASLVAVPVLTGAAAFGVFFGAAAVARHIPVLNEALVSVLSYAERGADSWVLATTLANGLAEEVFFRGSLFTALGSCHPVAASTAIYMLSTCATRNPALVVAAGVMGSVFAAQRRSSGGLLTPILTHVTWSALMVRYLPVLFRKPPARARIRRLGTYV
jgi:membrane protease YdiL (CAAX protease family)